MRVEDVREVKFDLPANWREVQNSLVTVPPGEVVEGLPEGDSSWDTYFVQDLLLLEDETAGRVIDVGWYPERQPDGAFRLLLLSSRITPRGTRAQWDVPIEAYETRDLDSLIQRIHELVRGK